MSAGDFPLILPISGTAHRGMYMAALPADHARVADGATHMVKLYLTPAEATAMQAWFQKKPGMQPGMQPDYSQSVQP